MIPSIKSLVKEIRFGGGPYRCNICQHRVRKFFPFSNDLRNEAVKHGFAHDFHTMETLNIDQCNCPFCLSNDRERLYLIYLETFLSHHKGNIQILDFAPNPKFSSHVRSFPGVKYTSADLFRDDVDLKLDVCDMSTINDNTYDAIICSHVLEHVGDPDQGMRELYRILKPGGWAIVMVPLFSGTVETMENPSHNSDALRTKYYGQHDHLRLFSHDDFVERLTQVGFFIREVTPSELDADKIKENAISSNSILYVGTKLK